ncbi:SRPBCC family protein [Thermomonospora catenispora]|uniref:SRPBCC family protein n=1 Tax=Thermomonospora catenispora TaxID=2493090 RepID=UPI00111CDA99|nr:SRPBCC family protein [Thermomonospora catenispora]TNY36234.1 SRPBCC family protein [Thermomonospora catenispora]
MADRTSSSITIKAGRDEIMAVIADLEAYPEWTDGIRDVEVLDTGPDGRPARARLTIDAGPVRDSYTLAYTWRDDGVRWELAERGAVVSGLRGSYRLREGADGTEVTYELTVDVRMPMIGLVKRKAEKRIVDSALNGLRRRLEG